MTSTEGDPWESKVQQQQFQSQVNEKAYASRQHRSNGKYVVLIAANSTSSVPTRWFVAANGRKYSASTSFALASERYIAIARLCTGEPKVQGWPLLLFGRIQQGNKWSLHIPRWKESTTPKSEVKGHKRIFGMFFVRSEHFRRNMESLSIEGEQVGLIETAFSKTVGCYRSSPFR